MADSKAGDKVAIDVIGETQDKSQDQNRKGVQAEAQENKPPTQVKPEVKKTLLGGKRKAVKVKDTKTGVVYGSKSKAGKALAKEFGLDPDDNFVWYKIVKKAPERFVKVGE